MNQIHGVFAQGGPFGDPDGARAELDDFVDMAAAAAFAEHAVRPDDRRVRVIVGKKGSGKTVHLRRLQDAATHEASLYTYADRVDPSDIETSTVIQVCQWFQPSLLPEKWSLIWNRSILRSVATHLLRNRKLASYMESWEQTAFARNYARVLDTGRRPRSVYACLTDIVRSCRSGRALSAYLDDPLWRDLEDEIGELLESRPPICFYIDAIDDEFQKAPLYWLRCQEGLFQHVMRLLRDSRLGGRLHIIVAVRDIVLSSIYRTEHAPRYHNEPHIAVLDWDDSSIRYLLETKLRRVTDEQYLFGRPRVSSLEEWLGHDTIENVHYGITEELTPYVLRHTRMVPRDVITMGNELAGAVRMAKAEGESTVAPEVIRSVVARSARVFGNAQLEQCASQVAADTMPLGAAEYDVSEYYTSSVEYRRTVSDQIRSLMRRVGSGWVDTPTLVALDRHAAEQFSGASRLSAALWQNGLLGYAVDNDARAGVRFYSLDDIDRFTLPTSASLFAFHPCVLDAVEIRGGGDVPIRAVY